MEKHLMLITHTNLKNEHYVFRTNTQINKDFINISTLGIKKKHPTYKHTHLVITDLISFTEGIKSV